MEIKINYKLQLQNEVKEQINFIREEFDNLFQDKLSYSEHDRRIANDLLKYFSKIIDSPVSLEYLERSLEYLENRYQDLF